jgi:hypothetical protein
VIYNAEDTEIGLSKSFKYPTAAEQRQSDRQYRASKGGGSVKNYALGWVHQYVYLLSLFADIG